MKKIALSVLAVVAFAGAANAQNIEFRWVERHNQASIAPGAAPVVGDTSAGVGNGTDATLFLSLEARVVGGTLGLSTFGGSVITNDAFNAVRNTSGNTQGFLTAPADASAAGSHVNSARATVNFNPNFNQPWVNADGDPLTAGRGIFNPFRQIANLGNAANGIADDTDGTTPGLQNPATNSLLNLFGNMAQADFTANAGNDFGNQGFIPLFITRYDVTDLTARTLTFTYEGFVTAFSGFVGGLPVEALTQNISATYTVSIVPAPGAAALLGLGGLLAARRRRA